MTATTAPVDTNNHSSFTGFQYVLIDIASQWGLDKLTFPERLEWAYKHFNDFESLAEDRGHFKEHPLYMKSVMGLRRIQAGQPTGMLVGLDAVCSGMQVLSAATGCETGARSTGMVTPDERADAYTACTEAMQRRIPAFTMDGRADIKDACMTTLYGSVKVPESIFGEDTPELQAFYESLYEIAPGACKMISVLKLAWRPYALKHAWILPDNHHAEVPVEEMVDTKIEIDELEHTTFSYTYSVNKGSKKGLSLIANVTHSIDAWVLRSMIRRCNYDEAKLLRADNLIQEELLQRHSGIHAEPQPLQGIPEHGAQALIYRYQRTAIADISMVNYLDEVNVRQVSSTHLHGLARTLCLMQTHEPFPVVCIHDEFKTSPLNVNYLRMHYREILAELADGDVLNDIVGQITGRKSLIAKLSTTLGDKIRQSNYALC